MSDSTDDLTGLIRAWRGGDAAAQEVLFAEIHSELTRIASLLLRRESGKQSLDTGDLVNNAVLRLLQSPDAAPEDKAHLLALSAHVMRHVLIDEARKKYAEKRRKITVTLSEDDAQARSTDVDLQRLEVVLIRLKAIDPARAELVTMRYYGGMTFDEIAQVTSVSESTVKRTWRATRAWLREAMEDDT